MVFSVAQLPRSVFPFDEAGLLHFCLAGRDPRAHLKKMCGSFDGHNR
ncbi:hypothetical protein [Breoghania sp.]|nr:hypothetical protein [Breoghania sp.]